jgi:DNA-binding NarL/FixJ family response regulator
MDKPIRVFILSDNRLFREALTRIFSKKSDLEAVRSRQFGPDALEDVMKSEADVLVLDSAQFLSAERGQFMSRPHARAVKILMVAMKEDETLFLEAVKHGVCGYVAKDASAVDVLNSLRAVAQGEAVCPPRLCKYLFDYVARFAHEFPGLGPEKPLVLTRREEQLIPFINEGLTNKEIAARLNLSEKTVKNHIHRILRKVGAETRVGLAAAFRSSARSARLLSTGPFMGPS